MGGCLWPGMPVGTGPSHGRPASDRAGNHWLLVTGLPMPAHKHHTKPLSLHPAISTRHYLTSTGQYGTGLRKGGLPQGLKQTIEGTPNIIK